MSRIDGQRREHREHFRLKERRHPLHFIGRKLVHAHEANAVRFERRQQLLMQRNPATLKQLFDSRACRNQLVRGRQRIWLILRRTAGDFASQTGKADHVELVQVRAEDCQKLQTLQQRNARVQCFFKDARVELEPTQLTVQIRQRQRRQRGHSESGQ